MLWSHYILPCGSFQFLSLLVVFTWITYYGGICQFPALKLLFVSRSKYQVFWRKVLWIYVNILFLMKFSSYLFCYLYWHGPVDPTFTQWFIIRHYYYYYYFYAQKCARSGQWKPLEAGICVHLIVLLILWVPPYFLAQEKISGSSWTFPAAVLESATSPRCPDSFEWKMVFRNQDVGTKCAHCYWDIWCSQPCLHRAKAHMYVCSRAPAQTHMYTYIYIYFGTYLYVLKTSNSNQETMLLLGFSLFTSPMARNLVPITLSTAAYLVSFPSCAQLCVAAASPTCMPVQIPFSPYTRLAPQAQGLLILLRFDTLSQVSLCGRHVRPSRDSGSEGNTF